MHVSFHGAAREVTGSCHLLEVDGRRVLLDCGMIQGGRKRHLRNREAFPFDAGALGAVVLSHAHIDHSGRLPLLLRAGYRGRILTTEATASLCRILLADSAHIHEEDAKWKIKRLKKRGEDWRWVTPLFTREEAAETIDRLEPVAFGESRALGDNCDARFVKAGHILGAAIVELDLRQNGSRRRLVFSGDLGVDGARLLGRPEPVDCPDVLLIESTYGNRRREETGDRTELLLEIIERTAERGGKVIVPSFAVGRTQEILARINDLVESGRLSGIPVYVDSPMAIAATQAFGMHPEAYSDQARRSLRCGDEPLAFDGLTLTRSVEESMEIKAQKGPAVLISASGMCTAGRIKHHLKHNISDARSTILFVGYQAHGTLGSVIRSGTDPVRIFGEWHRVRASVESVDGFSAHADLDELLAWFGSLGGVPRRTFVVHGEEESALGLVEALGKSYGARAEAPAPGQRFEIE